jgi:SsrA-binding protein
MATVPTQAAGKGRGGKGGRAPAPEVQEILYNRKLRHDYRVIDSWEAGMVLMGSEAKSLRAGDVQWGDAHARMERGELWLHGLHIGEYRFAVGSGHQPAQARKLLLSRRELDRLEGALTGKGLTVVPERLLFRRGWAKIVICLAQGKTHEDQRQDLVARATQRDVQRELARRMKRSQE